MEESKQVVNPAFPSLGIHADLDDQEQPKIIGKKKKIKRKRKKAKVSKKLDTGQAIDTLLDSFEDKLEVDPDIEKLATTDEDQAFNPKFGQSKEEQNKNKQNLFQFEMPPGLDFGDQIEEEYNDA